MQAAVAVVGQALVNICGEGRKFRINEQRRRTNAARNAGSNVARRASAARSAASRVGAACPRIAVAVVRQALVDILAAADFVRIALIATAERDQNEE